MIDETTNIEQVNENLSEPETNAVAGEIPAEEIKQEEVLLENNLFEAVKEISEEAPAEPEPQTEIIEEPIPATVADVIQVEAPAVEEAVAAETPAEPTPVVEEVILETPVAEEAVASETPVVEEVVVAETPAVEETITAEAPSVEQAITSETTAAEEIITPVAEHSEKPAKEKPNMQEKYDAVYKELLELKEANSIIEVEIKGRIRGGLRAIYKEMPLFLPASHYSLKRTPTEQELADAIGKTFSVHIHELQEYDEGRKAVIVSRKNILVEEFWTKIQIGDKVEGRVSSIAPFGVFLDLGGVEGLIHISRLSQIHVDDPNKFLKKGDMVKAVVVELDRNRNRIALDRKALEESPWKDAESLYTMGSQHKGIVRRLTDFGAYVELKPGVDGLLRTPEISWTKRVKRPSDVLKAGQEIMVEILSVSEEKQTVSLSYKKTQPNPWSELVDKYPVGTDYTARVIQVMPQGCIISINEEIDGFMPRSKMKNILQGNKIPYHPGDSINVIIADLIPEEESLILAPVADETAQQPAKEEEYKRNYNPPAPKAAPLPPREGITFGDYLSEIDKKSLMNTLGE